MPNTIFPLIFAQHRLLTAAEPPPLVSTSRSSDVIASTLFESPGAWFLAFALVVVAMALITRPQRKLQYVGAVLVILAIGVGVLEHLVITEREAIIASSRVATFGVAKADSSVLQRLLSPDFRIVYFEAPQGLGKEETIRRAVAFFGTHRSEISIAEIRAVADNDRFGRSQVHLTGRSELTGGYPESMWWGLNWEKTSAGWQLKDAELLSQSIVGRGL